MSNMTRGFFEPDRFELLDSLPKSLRLALAAADYDWCVASFVEDYEETDSVAKTIAYVRRPIGMNIAEPLEGRGE